jgi:acetyl esterase/lipase
MRGARFAGCLVLGWAAVLGLSACLEAAPFKAPDYILFEHDVVYGKGGDQELHLDIARRKDLKKPAPCIVAIHGGAWRAGDKAQLRNLCVKCAEMGYVAATVQYRFCPKNVFPAQVEDTKCAVRFLRASAEKYQIDPKKFGSIGFSAGGHLAMMLGVTSKSDGLEGEGGNPEQDSRVQAVIAFFGPTQLDADDLPIASQFLVKDLIGGTPQEKPEAFKKASPVSYVSKDDGPILIFQGTQDPLVPHSQAYKMTDAMTKAGVPGRVELFVGA